jgi:hypothetical protein
MHPIWISTDGDDMSIIWISIVLVIGFFYVLYEMYVAPGSSDKKKERK